MPRQRLGQHFLLNGSILERIASEACSAPEPLVIEIGAGKGALTAHLLARAERVIAIELDPHLADFLARKFPGDPRLTVICADVLETDLTQWGPAVIAGNLPYYAATPILERVVTLESALRRAVLLIQKEVAERVTAAPGARDYGYLTLRTKLFADPEILFSVKPSAFYPPPKVDSAVLRLHPHCRAPELGIDEPEDFLKFVALCFRHKRKTVRNNLAGMYGHEIIDPWPEASLRAEQMTIEQFVEMYRRIAK